MSRRRYCRFIAAMLLAGLSGSCGDTPDTRGTYTEGEPAAQASHYDPHAFDQMEEGALRYYLTAQDALAHDRLEPARAALTRLVDIAATAALRPLASSAAEAADITAVRRAFKPLSAAMIASEVPEGFGTVFCHMAFDYEGAYWIQREGEIMNPYYGAGMLNCGAFKDTEGVRRRLETK